MAYDGVVRNPVNNFTNVGAVGAGCGQSNVYFYTINLNTIPNFTLAGPDMLIALRIRPIYADAQLYVDSGASTLPRQGNVVTSTGTTGSGITRRILVYQQYHSAPSIFEAAIVSQNALIK